MTRQEEEYRNELWRQFIQKVNNDWGEKYSKSYGSTFEGLANVELLRDFAKTIHSEIRNIILSKERNIKILISEDRLYSIFQSNTLSKNSHWNTINSFLCYIDCDNWETFKSLNKSIIDSIIEDDMPKAISAEQEKKLIDKHSVTREDLSKQIKEFYSRSTINQKVLIALVILSSSISLFVILNPTNKSNEIIQNPPPKELIEKNTLHTCINVLYNADTAEFESYKQLPIIDTSQIDKYFTKKGSARAKIVNRLIEHHKKGLILNNERNPSYFRIIDCHFVKKNGSSDELIFETKEHWFLQWYDSYKKRYHVEWNETNIQQYILKKENNIWKVDINDYEGEAHLMDI